MVTLWSAQWGLEKWGQEIKKLKLTFKNKIKESMTKKYEVGYNTYLLCRILIYLQCVGKHVYPTEKGPHVTCWKFHQLDEKTNGYLVLKYKCAISECSPKKAKGKSGFKTLLPWRPRPPQPPRISLYSFVMRFPFYFIF